MRRGGEAPLNLDHVIRGAWGDIAYRGTRAAWLELRTADQNLKLECTDHGASEDRKQFLALVRAICEELDGRHSALAIRTDSGSAYTTAIFIIGLVGIGVGLAVVLGSLYGTFLPGNPLALIAGAIGAAACFLLAASHAPWRQYVPVSPADLLQMLPAR